MRFVLTGSTCAAMIALGMAGFAQEPNQPRGEGAAPTQQDRPTGQDRSATQERASADDQQVTVVGCVQSESDYRRAQDAGKGGAAGTGVGVGNEFVLINASMSTAARAGGAAPSGATGSGASTPTGTAGVASGASAYELTGSGEGQAASHVGKRVEIVGKIKPAEIGASGPTGGPTAGAPPRGVDVASDDLKLRELEVTSVRETTGSCSAAK
jgi:hypothetical protein